MSNPYVKIEVPDYRKIVEAVSAVRNGALVPAIGASPTPACSEALRGWQVVPDDEDPSGFVRVFLGFVLGSGTAWCLPAGDDVEMTWLPGETRYTRLEITEQGDDGTSGFVYWYCEKDTDGRAALPGTVALAVDAATVVAAVAESAAFVVLAEIRWNSLDPCGYQVEQLYASAIVLASPIPDTASDLEDRRNKSVEDKLLTLTSGTVRQVRQIHGFDDDATAANGLAGLLEANLNNGKISATGGKQYEVLVRVKNAASTERAIAFMPIGPVKPGSKDPDGTGDSEDADDCHEGPPGGNGGGVEERITDDERPPPGGNPGGGHDDGVDFPGKTWKCW